MKASGISLGSVLPPVTAEALRASLATRTERPETESTSSLITGFVCEQAASLIQDRLMAVDLVEVLAQAWATLAELHEYADATAHPADKPETVVFSKKTLKAPQDIELKLRVGDLPVVPLVLTIDLKIDFECVRLTVGGGRITAIDLGTAVASAGLKYQNATLVKSRQTPPMHFGSGWDLGEGLRIH